MRKFPQNALKISLLSTIISMSLMTHANENPKQEDTESKDKDVERILILSSPVGRLSLKDESSTASRLGLSALETPATIEIVDAELMRARGYTKLSDSLANLPGVVTGEHPTAPSTFSMRGFSRGQITVLRDGLWIGPSTMVMRPQNTFNLERIEILRGPASVLNGLGSVAGTVNAITKTAKIGMQDSTNFQLGYGSHNSFHAGIGSQGQLTDNTWYSADFSRYSSDGYVERTDSESNNATASVVWQANDDLWFKVSADYLEDDVGSYYGTPLVPRNVARSPMNVITTGNDEVLDAAMRYKNYNVEDAYAKSDQLFVRLDTDWVINPEMRLHYTLFNFTADRAWQNAEGYVYCTEQTAQCTEIGEIQRYNGYFMLDHQQDVLGNRLTLNVDSMLGDIESRLVLGAEVIDLDFERTRGYRRNAPQVAGDGVDPYNPIAGRYGTREVVGISPTEIDTLALFFGNALQLTESLSLVTGARYEEVDLTRENLDAQGNQGAGGFERKYDWVSWRVGTVYSFTDEMALYGQYSNAKDPINSNIFLVSDSQNFDLTDAVQTEIGFKASLLDGKAETTFAYYHIERDDIYEQFDLDSVTNVGGRTSEGVEASLTMTLDNDWRFGANAAYTHAEFKRSANFDKFAGNTPPNVPELTANLWGSVDNVAGLPIEIGASLHYVDERYGDNANTVTLHDYTLTHVFAAYKGDNYRVTARIDNLFDEKYVPWSDVFYLHKTNPNWPYANQLLLGAPRSARLMFDYQF